MWGYSSVRLVSRKSRMSAPLCIGTTIIFQRFGIDVYNVDSFDAKEELKESIDFVGYDVDGEYTSANYNAQIYKNIKKNYVFKGKECFEIIFEYSDDISFL